ncbi:uncharacterized protein N0V89_009751 [Didymosphaeria variabile]|uniref:BTB domain-containing protein n=1 Tax=Didymosphaeria variabile TaxID=1932322 RepID=A0A9W8XEE9_9PLEO|nr:uncharacterized protein N0V89_009751 [Didymosphaeria variabile]KAJ4348377.1 hypothetical protein N0V89_009751 [Didymosphaeria variabile]
MPSSPAPISRQESSLDNVRTPPAGSSSHKRKGESCTDVLADTNQDTATSPRKRRTPLPTKLAPSGRIIQLQARDTDEVFKINTDTLVRTSELFKHKLFRETQPSLALLHRNKGATHKNDAPSRQPTGTLSQPLQPATTVPSTPVDPRYPVVHLNVDRKALFLYCLWTIDPPDRLSLSLSLDSTIPSPSTSFTIYLYEAFLLALELKDATFFANIVPVILKDGDAGTPQEEAITWVYENTGSVRRSLLKEFVVDFTLTWADEAVGEWRRVASGAPAEFVVDVSCRLLELYTSKRAWMKSDVATEYTYEKGWPVEDMKSALAVRE